MFRAVSSSGAFMGRVDTPGVTFTELPDTNALALRAPTATPVGTSALALTTASSDALAASSSVSNATGSSMIAKLDDRCTQEATGGKTVELPVDPPEQPQLSQTAADLLQRIQGARKLQLEDRKVISLSCASWCKSVRTEDLGGEDRPQHSSPSRLHVCTRLSQRPRRRRKREPKRIHPQKASQ